MTISLKTLRFFSISIDISSRNTFVPRPFLIGCRSSETEVTALDVQTVEVPSPGHFSFGFDS